MRKEWIIIITTLIGLAGIASASDIEDFNAAVVDDHSFTVFPVEYPKALRNPLKGFRPETYKNNFNHKYATVTRCYIKWNALENDEADTIQKIKDYCDQRWSDLEVTSIKVIPRVYLDWDRQSGNEYWPEDMVIGDYSSEQFKERLVRLISRLGECWDHDPRVAWVQLGLIGYWGEHHNPSPSSEIQTLMGDAITSAFTHKKVLVRHPDEFLDYEVGVYWDSWAHQNQTYDVKQGAGIEALNDVTSRWKMQPIEGEVAYDWGEFRIQPGDNPDDTLSDPEHRDFLIDTIRNLHCSALGWVANYTQTNPIVQAGANQVQKAFGYRFVIPEFSSLGQVEADGDLNVSFSVVNTGSAPFYYDWPVELSLIAPKTRAVVWKTILDQVDIRQWLPGDDWDEGNNVYLIPAETSTIDVAVTLPGLARLPVGEYIVALSILDPDSMRPSVRFAIQNYFNGGRHPLGRVGIRTVVNGDHAVNAQLFDDPMLDESVGIYP